MFISLNHQKNTKGNKTDWQQQQKTKYLSIPSAAEDIKQQELAQLFWQKGKFLNTALEKFWLPS